MFNDRLVNGHYYSYLCCGNNYNLLLNGKSAKAAKIQTDEIIMQFNLANRPNVTIHFDIIWSDLLCFVIENEGTSPAHNLSIKIKKDFLE